MNKYIEHMPIKVKPYRHQIQGFELCMQNEGFGLLFDVGLGKSLTAVATAGARHRKGQVNRVLVVCPLAVVPVWEREFNNLNVDYTAYALEGSSQKKKDTLRNIPSSELQIVIINYDSARIMVDDLLRFNADMLIVDESQKIKNPRSQQTKSVHKLAKQAKYRLILTATPVGNSVADVYSQWKVIDENIFGKSFYAFRARYLIMGGYQNHQIIGTRNMDELLAKMHSKALRVTKEEALDLPKQVFETRYCELEAKAKAVYNSLKYDCYSELINGEITARNILTKLLRLQQCADGFLKADESEYYEKVSTAKLELLEDTLDEVLSNKEKVIVFARFTEEIHAIERRLRKLNIKTLTLDGSTKDKGAMVNEFQTNQSIKVLICQTQVGGVGITLTAASIVIFYSLTFSLIDYLQAIGRTHRIGQKYRCLYIDLIAKNTVDEHIQKAIKNKRNLSDNIVDNWRDIIGG